MPPQPSSPHALPKQAGTQAQAPASQVVPAAQYPMNIRSVPSSLHSQTALSSQTFPLAVQTCGRSCGVSTGSFGVAGPVASESTASGDEDVPTSGDTGEEADDEGVAVIAREPSDVGDEPAETTGVPRPPAAGDPDEHEARKSNRERRRARMRRSGRVCRTC